MPNRGSGDYACALTPMDSFDRVGICIFMCIYWVFPYCMVMHCNDEECGSVMIVVRLLSTYILLVLFSGCTSTATEEYAYSASTDIVFFDSKVFDLRLSEKLEDSPTLVDIEFQGDVRLDELPDRIDAWISSVDANGGRVNIIEVGSEGVAARGLMADSVELMFKGVDYLKKKSTFQPVEDYDATLYYKADGTVQTIRLERR
jgi:hypothetical protein